MPTLKDSKQEVYSKEFVDILRRTHQEEIATLQKRCRLHAQKAAQLSLIELIKAAGLAEDKVIQELSFDQRFDAAFAECSNQVHVPSYYTLVGIPIPARLRHIVWKYAPKLASKAIRFHSSVLRERRWYDYRLRLRTEPVRSF